MYRKVDESAFEAVSCATVFDGRIPARFSAQDDDLKNIIGIDLFAGARGFSLAALSIGIDILCAVENQKNAAATYSANLRRRDGSPVRLFERDILSVEPKDVLKD